MSETYNPPTEEMVSTLFKAHHFEDKYSHSTFAIVIEFGSITDSNLKSNVVYRGWQISDPFSPHEFEDSCDIFQFYEKFYPVMKNESN